MRLIPVIVLGYAVVGLQAGLGGFVQLAGAAPNLVLIVVVFLSLFSSRDSALLACFLLGLMQDLLTQQTLGLYALAYGLLALALSAAGSVLYREHPATHAATALVGSIFSSLILMIHGAIFGGGPTVGAAAAEALLSGLLAPVLIWLLQKLRPTLGLKVARKWT
ncbi:MAG: rod shape-determining protein MreD [Phycisphaerae bacterium]|nr:rod shape-determining protein MreD [Phycisphaerae bacterium]MDW8260984.1 rod shape-determining protein MreD [Phycisphaerales bacterium]